MKLGLRLIDSNFPVLGLTTSALLRLCRTASRWLHSLAPAQLPWGFVHVARPRPAQLIDSRPRSSTLSRSPVYTSRLPPDVFAPGTLL